MDEDHEDSAEYTSPLLMRKKRNKDLKELRQRAMRYYQEKKIPEILEKLLNDMYYDQPNDIFSYLSNFFKKLAKPPTFNKIWGFEKFGSNGYRVLGCKIYCTILDTPQMIAEGIISKDPVIFSDFSSIASSGITLIDGPLNRVLRNCDLRNAVHCDEEIMKFVHESENKIDTILLEDLDAMGSDSRLRSTPREKKSIRTDLRRTSMTPRNSPPRRLTTRHSSRDEGRPDLKGGIMEWMLDDWWTQLGKVTLSKAAYCVSMAVHRAAAFLAEVPLYREIALSVDSETSDHKFQIPRVMVTILSKNKLNSGKINIINEVGLILDLNRNFRMVIGAVMKLVHRTNELLHMRSSSTHGLFNTAGAAVENFDKLEYPLEFLNELLYDVDVETKKSITYYLQFSLPDDLRENDKGKIEIIKGQAKTWEEVVDMYIELVKSFPVSIIIDPLPSVAESAWEKLTEQASTVSVNIMKTQQKSVTESFDILEGCCNTACGSVVRPTSLSTVSKVISFYKELVCSSEHPIALEASEFDVGDPFIVDLAVGVHVPYLKVGGLMKAENVMKINRLMDICEELEQEAEDHKALPKSTMSDLETEVDIIEVKRLLKNK